MGDENISIFLVFFVALLALVLVLSKYLHDRPIISSLLPEAAMILLVAMVAGFFIHLAVKKKKTLAGDTEDDNIYENNVDDDLSALLSFSPDIFFVALLPPIIFNSGLRIGPLFFRHIAPIVLFAGLGTTISAVSVALFLKLILQLGFFGDFAPTFFELLTFGALISSTDPVCTLAVLQAKKVDPQLFYLVFGESVLNDVLSIVLFDSLSKFVGERDVYAGNLAQGFAQLLLDLTLDSIGSLCLGCIGGLGTALLFKHVDMRQNRLLEISTYLLLMYIPFLLAEIMHLSGIVTILFTGITANRYVVPNLSPITKVNADMLFRLLSHLAETSIFLELGLSVFGLIGNWNWSFIGWSLLACLVGRALNVYPIAFLFNKCLRHGNHLDDDETETMDRFRVTHQSNTELGENFVPSVQKHMDEDMVLTNQRAMSFSEASQVSEMTVTPLRRKDLKIRSSTTHFLWFSGLRGAVAYACVRTFPDNFGHQKEFTMATMAIVLITVFLLGGTTEMVLRYLKIKVNVDEETYMRERLREPVVASAISNFGESFHRWHAMVCFCCLVSSFVVCPDLLTTILDHNYISRYVIRDFLVFHGNQMEEANESSQTGGRAQKFVETIEMTESAHFDNVAQPVGLRKLPRRESLFDYGAN
jgi:NhaP-type Na+/H+ or K+/H+ antiporter